MWRCVAVRGTEGLALRICTEINLQLRAAPMEATGGAAATLYLRAQASTGRFCILNIESISSQRTENPGEARCEQGRMVKTRFLRYHWEPLPRTPKPVRYCSISQKTEKQKS